MSDTDTLTLAPTGHDSPGIIHRRFTREASIAADGEAPDIADGEKTLFGVSRSGARALSARLHLSAEH